MSEPSRTEQALSHLEDALREFERTKDKYHPRTYELMTQPIVEDIAEYRRKIELEKR